MKNIHQSLKVKYVRKIGHLYFNLLNFHFFENSQPRQALFFGSPRFLSHLAVVPYILVMEVVFFRRKRFFVTLKGRLVGMFALREKSEALYISSLAVAPEYRKFGIATYILDYTQKLALQLNKKWLELSVSKMNSPALRLYRRFGFKVKQEKKWSLILRKKVNIY